MPNSKLTHIAFISRLLLGFLFIYHGLVPKILCLSPVETQLVSLSGLDVPKNIISLLAGIGEVLLGGSIIFFKKSIIPIYIAMVILLLLLFFIGLVSPEYLVEAFNPVTTNILGLSFCYLIWFTYEDEKV